MEFISVLINAIKNGFLSIIDLAFIIIPLMLAIEILKALKILEKISSLLSPLAKTLNIHKDASLPMVIGLALGLFFGAGVLFQSVEEGNMDKKSIVIVCVFLGICHALVEDTLVFIPTGANLMIVFFSRLIAALLIAYITSKLIKNVKELS
jgi:hypothetical protein